MVQLTDTLDASTNARICADGSLVAEVNAARVGIQTYLRSETDAPASFTADTVRAYRPPEEVFSRDSMASFAAAPFTIDHPTVPVTADNWRDLGVGEVNGDVVRDGGFVRVPVIVRDSVAVEKVRTTHKQLSMGYACTLDWTPGTTPDGQAYDAIQRDIRINHIAAVPAARGGPELKISDYRPPQETPTVPKMMLIDGLTVDVSNADTAEATIKTLITARDAATAQVTDLSTQVATLTAESTTKDAKITTLEQQVKDAKPTAAQLRDAGKALLLAADKAKALGVTVTDEMDADQIMAATVNAKMGDKAKGWTADQIAASFAVLTVDTATTDTGVQPIGSPVTIGDAASLADTAWTKANGDLNAWRVN